MVSLSGLGWVYAALLVVFALIFVGVLVALWRGGVGRKAGSAVPAPAPATTGTLADAMARPGAVAEPYLSRFVVDGSGERQGETISISGDRVIVKREGAFHSVALAAVTIESGELVAHGVDWEAAKREGEAWRATQASQHEALEFDDPSKKDA